MSAAKHTIILGAGPAGLAVGHEVSQNGGKVTVLERNDYVGGLCLTVHDEDYKFDLGGHRWFSKNEHLNQWFRRLMEGEIVIVDRISRIYYGGKYFNYPVKIGDVIKNTNVFGLFKIFLSYGTNMIRQAVRSKDPVTMEQAYTSMFGRELYEMFFRRYSEKVWGKTCDKLSADWVGQRATGLSVWKIVRDAVMGSNKQVVSLIDQFMYPRDGYMRIPERMAEDIVNRGNDVKLKCTVTGITYHGPKDVEVSYLEGEQEKSVRGDAVVSTIPLNLLARSIKPACDNAVVEAANGLEFRDLIVVFVKLARPRVTEDTWLYVQDQEILFGRIHEPKNWSAAMVPDDDHTSLVLECFCSAGDNIWSMTDDEIADRCVDDLVTKLKFLDRSEVDGAQVIRTRHAYPIYDLDYSGKIGIIQDFITSHDGIYVVGRGGTFRYNNADHSIEMGLLLGRKLLGYDTDYMAVNTEQEYHEEIQSPSIARDYYQDQGEESGDEQSKPVPV